MNRWVLSTDETQLVGTWSRQVIANGLEWVHNDRPAAVERASSPQSPHGWFEAA